VSKFDDLTRAIMVVKVKSKALFIGPYSNSQQRLFDRVFLLRERDLLTFEAIAKLLTKSGTRSVNGCLLGAEHVYSTYKKGKLRQERLTLKVEPELLDLWFE
jgi:hypothetical protein